MRKEKVRNEAKINLKSQGSVTISHIVVWVKRTMARSRDRMNPITVPLTIDLSVNPISTPGMVTCMKPVNGTELICTTSCGHVAMIDTSSGDVRIVAGKKVTRRADGGRGTVDVDGQHHFLTDEEFSETIRGQTYNHRPANPQDVVYWFPHSIFWCGAANGWIIADQHDELSFLSEDFSVVRPFLRIYNPIKAAQHHPTLNNGMTCLCEDPTHDEAYLYVNRFAFVFTYTLNVRDCCDLIEDDDVFLVPEDFQRSLQNALAVAYGVPPGDVLVIHAGMQPTVDIELLCVTKEEQVRSMRMTLSREDGALRRDFVSAVYRAADGIDVRGMELVPPRADADTNEHTDTSVDALHTYVHMEREPIDRETVGSTVLKNMVVLPDGRIIVHNSSGNPRIWEVSYMDDDDNVVQPSEAGSWKGFPIMNMDAGVLATVDGRMARAHSTQPHMMCPVFCGKGWGILLRDAHVLRYVDMDNDTVSTYNLRAEIQNYVEQNAVRLQAKRGSVAIGNCMTVCEDGTFVIPIEPRSQSTSSSAQYVLKISGFEQLSGLPKAVGFGGDDDMQSDGGGGAAAASSSAVGPTRAASTSSSSSSSSDSSDDDEASEPPKRRMRMNLRF